MKRIIEDKAKLSSVNKRHIKVVVRGQSSDL
jgi:hypothetical protein